MTELLGWWFHDGSGVLPHDDGRPIELGATHTIENEPVLCKHGLHASVNVLDALQYATGNILYRVRLSGTIVKGDDKACATARTYLARIDAEPILREFARKCALNVIHLWDPPAIVREYLETGNEDIRAAAWDAARAAAWAAARAAARDAARAAAWAAARDAARDAARAAQSELLTTMITKAIEER